jgi:carbon storage regulator CsrA
MLNLTRKPNESIVITTANGEVIEVIVTSIKGNQVRLGIAADDSVAILRAELLDDVA